MKVETEILQKAISLAGACTQRKRRVSATNNVFLRMKEDGMSINGWDGENHLEIHIKGEGPKTRGGTMSLSPKALTWLQKTTTPTVEVTAGESPNQKLAVSWKNPGGQTAFRWAAEQRFQEDTLRVPLPIPGNSTTQEATYCAEDIRRITQVCGPTASRDENRWILCGVKLQQSRPGHRFSEPHHTAVATNARILSTCTLSHQPGGGIDALIPNRGVEVLEQILAAGLMVNGCRATAWEDRLRFSCETQTMSLTFVCKLLEGKYPRWEQALPRKEEEKPGTRLETKDLLGLLGAATENEDTCRLRITSGIVEVTLFDNTRESHDEPTIATYAVAPAPPNAVPGEAIVNKTLLERILKGCPATIIMTWANPQHRIPMGFEGGNVGIYHALMPLSGQGVRDLNELPK
jgi:DNA polymerase III sliding clamp (beta) subunit (PCNA family)